MYCTLFGFAFNFLLRSSLLTEYGVIRAKSVKISGFKPLRLHSEDCFSIEKIPAVKFFVTYVNFHILSNTFIVLTSKMYTEQDLIEFTQVRVFLFLKKKI